ncbi:transmembrane protein 71 isoform X1 [Elephas maximus indicus]|uniref:transmembrane protein 71 isoform X1 n=1 Tax=Elephas maximus indicus TaxID=99487 RepID=UPI0021161603|nr:transmembrane protein 71 isoform X1 [Elephas maximus indicus]XP_049710096.1 transmembrane protein 71 isoform X1 [Elephas maximus indicus]
MYRVSQLMSTPVASSPGLERERTGELTPTCIFPSFASDFLNGDSSFECCFIDPLTGSHFTCRRSPRLLTNGYYIWTEDSFLCDEDGNVTLSPSQTSVMYKENLVTIFRKKKRIRRSLSSLFNLSTSKSWLRGSIFGDADPSSSEDIWLEGLDTHHHNENGSGFDCSLTDDWALEEPSAESMDTSPSREASLSPREISCDSCLQTQLTASEHFQNSLDHPKTSLLQEVSFQAILLAACFIFSAWARWFLGGILASVFTCPLVITIVCKFCQVIVSQHCQLFQSHHRCLVGQNLTSI